MYFSHWKPPAVSERMWSVNLDASISCGSDPRRAFLPAFRVTGSAGDKPGSADNKPGSTWERRRHVWEHLQSQSCIQFVFWSMYLCIYIATNLHTVYLDWLQAVLERNLRCTWKWRSGELRDILRGCDRGSMVMQLEAVIKHMRRCTWRGWLSELRDSFRDHHRASLAMHLEAMLVGTRRP